MTCIAACVEDDVLCMGGDSAQVAGWDNYITAHPKVWKNGEWLFGYSGDLRPAQAIEYLFVPPSLKGLVDLHRIMCSAFVHHLADCLTAERCLRTEHGVMKMESNLLVGVRNRLFVVHEDLAVTENLKPYIAIGCGMDYAYGAFGGMEGLDISAYNRVDRALKVAEEWSNGVCGPFHIETL